MTLGPYVKPKRVKVESIEDICKEEKSKMIPKASEQNVWEVPAENSEVLCAEENKDEVEKADPGGLSYVSKLISAARNVQ